MVAVALAAAAGLPAVAPAAAPRPAPLVPIGAGLRGLPGLRATVYARGVIHVAALVRDARGRVWAAAAGLIAHGRDGVYVIARPDARPVRVIAGLDDPLGLVWSHGTLYVSSVGRVTAFSDLHGRRFAHRRTILRGPVAGGENNVLVLMGGRFVMGVTAGCDHCLPRSPLSGSIVSFAPDGAGLTRYAARIRAPVGLTRYPGTDDLLVSMNQRDDLGARTTGDAGRRGAGHRLALAPVL
jgi:glucose/arabinose dehydrogenase